MIKVLVPYMPTADDLLPYLRRIDESKVYTNNGPLAKELECLMTSQLGIPCVAVSNATVGLELALRYAKLGSDVGSAVTSPLTFAATHCAIRNAGLEIETADVREDTWAIGPAEVKRLWRVNPRSRISARVVVPVAAYGRNPRLWEWGEFQEKSGVPVVVDAAGALPHFLGSDAKKTLGGQADVLATVFSLHATKGVGAGEGGLVCTNDKTCENFLRDSSAFRGSHGTNAKMSEYHAAVALASLNPNFEKIKNERMKFVARNYLRAGFGDLGLPIGSSFAGSSLFCVKLPGRIYPKEAAETFYSRGIETKRWYAPFPREGHWGSELKNALELASQLIGLPYHAYLTFDDIAHVCGVLKEILS